MPRTSRHNRGRKPLYKEHRNGYVEPGHLEVSTFTPFESAQLILDRGARYMDGMFLERGLNWKPHDDYALASLAAVSSDIERCAEVLGRPPKSLANRVRDLGLSMPTEWGRLIRPKYIPRPRQPGIELHYPFIKKARPEHADLKRANSLVPNGFPEHMRADICQSVMLAMFEGTVTLEEVERNSTKMRWFIAKFYKDQRPWQEVLDTGDEDDDRPYHEKHVHNLNDEFRQNENRDAGRMREQWHRIAAPIQEESVFFGEMLRTSKAAYNRGDNSGIKDVMRRVESGSYDGPIISAAMRGGHHAMSRAASRYGMLLSSSDLPKISALAAKATVVYTDSAADHVLVAFKGKEILVVRSGRTGHIVTLLPPSVKDRAKAVMAGRMSRSDYARANRQERDAQNDAISN